TTNIVIVGIVYATLLAPLGAAGGVPVPWANTILHVVTPVLAALDWLLIGDRKRLPLSRLWLVLIYPATWLTVVLIRGATDGWVPYPFLDPSNGYGSVAIVCVGICVAVLLVGWLVFLASRYRPVKVWPGASAFDLDQQVLDAVVRHLQPRLHTALQHA